MNKSIFYFLIGILLCSSVHASEADTLFTKGMELLQEAMEDDNSKVVPAARYFAKCTDLYEKARDPEKAQQARACLYWCKKKMTTKDAEVFVKGMPDNYKNIVEAKVDAAKAKEYFNQAKEFAEKNPDDHLLIAIRYFEVADRFKGTDVSMEAQEKSLEAMQKVKTAPNFEPNKSKYIEGLASEAIDKAWKPYAEAVAKAKINYVKSLERALKYESSRGKLEEAKQIKEEIESISKPENILSTSELKSKQAERARNSYCKYLCKADKAYRRALEKAVNQETRKGNIEIASKIQNEIAIRDLKQSFSPAGKWQKCTDPNWITFRKDGSFTSAWKHQQQSNRGKWHREGLTIICTYDHGKSVRWTIESEEVIKEYGKNPFRRIK